MKPKCFGTIYNVENDDGTYSYGGECSECEWIWLCLDEDDKK